MKPTRIEFAIGQTRFQQQLRLVRERGSDGYVGWTLYKDAANQRDDAVIIQGLSAETIEQMAAAVRSVMP